MVVSPELVSKEHHLTSQCFVSRPFALPKLKHEDLRVHRSSEDHPVAMNFYSRHWPDFEKNNFTILFGRIHFLLSALTLH